MKREDMVACGQLVAQVKGLIVAARHGADVYDVMDSLLDDALELLREAPNEERERERIRKAEYRARKKKGQACPVGQKGTPAGRDGDSEVEEVVVVVEGEAVVAEEGEGRRSWSRDVAAVYEHYRTYHPRCAPKLPSTEKNYRLIVAALKTGRTVEDCAEAIDGYHRSPFHTGVNDRGQKYLGLDLIFRDADHVTKGIEMATDPLLDRGISEKQRRGVHAGVRWLERNEGGAA